MKPISLILFLACIASGQGTDGIATSVNRSITLTADEAAFSVVAGVGLDTSQQQVTQIFLDAGMANLSLTGTGLGQSYDYSKNPPATQTQLLYQFAFTVPAAGLKDAAKKLEALRAGPPALLQNMQYTVSLRQICVRIPADLFLREIGCENPAYRGTPGHVSAGGGRQQLPAGLSRHRTGTHLALLQGGHPHAPSAVLYRQGLCRPCEDTTASRPARNIFGRFRAGPKTAWNSVFHLSLSGIHRRRVPRQSLTVVPRHPLRWVLL